MAAPRSASVRQKDDLPSEKYLLMTMQAFAVAKDAKIVDRDEARRWLNRMYPDAQLAIVADAARGPKPIDDDPDEHLLGVRIPIVEIDTPHPPDGGLEALEQMDPADDEETI